MTVAGVCTARCCSVRGPFFFFFWINISLVPDYTGAGFLGLGLYAGLRNRESD